MIVPSDLSVERSALRKRFYEAQRGRTEVAASKVRLVEDIAQSRELMAQADFLLTVPYVK